MVGCPNPRTACPGRRLAGRKLASGFFGRCRRTSVRRTPRKSLNSRRVARPAATKTASGVRYYGLRYYNPGTGRFLNRDPMKEDGDVNLYAMVDNDPVIFFDFEGLRRSQSYDQYWTEWKAKHTGLTEAQYAWAKNILALGCIGITEINLGQYDPHTGVSLHEQLLEGQGASRCEQQRMKGGCSCGAKGTRSCFQFIFGTRRMVWMGKHRRFRLINSGKANMGNWDSRTGGRTLFGITMVNFDFGWVEDDGSITHADMYHNPDRKFSRIWTQES